MTANTQHTCHASMETMPSATEVVTDSYGCDLVNHYVCCLEEITVWKVTSVTSFCNIPTSSKGRGEHFIKEAIS